MSTFEWITVILLAIIALSIWSVVGALNQLGNWRRGNPGVVQQLEFFCNVQVPDTLQALRAISDELSSIGSRGKHWEFLLESIDGNLEQLERHFNPPYDEDEHLGYAPPR